MSEAGARCRLFTPPVAAALSAARIQARGAALRGGASEAQVDAAEDGARAKAEAAACNSPDLALAAARVRAGFKGYAQLQRMSFPGTVGAWAADRTPGPRWRLGEDAPGGVRFGLIEGADGREGLAAFWPGTTARGASALRLVLRDASRARSPYLDLRRRGLAGRLPPRALTTSLLAGWREAAPESVGVPHTRGGTLFRFPAGAAEALAGLDPREAVALELVFPTSAGERTATTLMEVGDFAAGRAFLAAR